jgi:hypothetical protein
MDTVNQRAAAVAANQIYQSRVDASTLVRVVHTGSNGVVFFSRVEERRSAVLNTGDFLSRFERCARGAL